MPIKTPLIAIAILIATLPGYADETMDEVLSELKSLREQVTQLEARLDRIEGTAKNIAPPSSSENKNERTGWFDNMRIELKKAEVRASGAWTNPASWTKVETGLTSDEVIALLGEPTDRKFSVRKDTDEIFYYRGDFDGEGDIVEGEVRIYKDKVRRFTTPDFPSE